VARACPFKTIGVVVLLLELVGGAAANAGEIKVLAAVAMADVFAELRPQFERSTGHKLTMRFEPPGVVKQRIDAGEPFDVTVLVPALMVDLAKQGKIIAETRADIARDSLGLAVRAGAAKPDISSLDAFRRALLDAKSFALVREGAAGPPHFNKVFERLGIVEEMKPKTRLQPSPGRVLEAVANGEVELGFVIISLIRRASGVELAGRLPDEVQFSFVFTAAVGTSAADAEAAKLLIKFLKSEVAVPVIKAKGMEPGTP